MPVLARPGLVDAVVRAHDAAHPREDGFSEGPKLELVERAVILVGGVRFAASSPTEMLLLVERAANTA